MADAQLELRPANRDKESHMTTRCLTPTSLALAVFCTTPFCGPAAGAAADGAPAAPAGLRVLKRGEQVFIRSAFSAEQDLVVRIGKGSNRQINFTGTRLISATAGMTEKDLSGGTLIHGNGDDATPWNINGTYIGGNHGCSDGRELTCPAHGRTASDLGSEWEDEAGARFHLIRIIDENRLWFLAPNAGKGDIWQFAKKISGSRLTCKARGAELTFSGNRMAQLRPACRISRQQYLADGAAPLHDGQPTSCGHLDIVEEYDIISPASLLADAVSHPGVERDPIASHLQGVIRNRITYRFHPNGANVIHYHAEALQEFRLGYMGFIQSARLYKGAYDTHEYYIPKTQPFTQDGAAYDFRAMQDYSERPPSPLRFRAADNNIEAPGNLPDRFIQFLGRRRDGATVREVGYALGYSLIHGLTVPETRAANAGSAIMLYTSAKSYPVAVDGKMGPVIPAGTRFHCVAYRHYFRPGLHGKATCLYWHESGDDVVVYADYHRAVDRDVLKLPAALTGKGIAVVEKTPSLTLHTAGALPAAGLAVSVAGDYGYVVLRLK